MADDIFDDEIRQAKELARQLENLNASDERGNRLRDERGRFVGADDSTPRGGGNRLRDERGRFIGADDSASRGGGNRLRDERGRFVAGQGWDWSTGDVQQRMKFEKQVDAILADRIKKRSAQLKFSRNDVNDIRGAAELLGGDVSVGNIKDAAAVLTRGKSDGLFGRISGPLAVGTMALQVGMELYGRRTTQIQENAQGLRENITFAQEIGLSGEQRQSVERNARKKARQQALEQPSRDAWNVPGRMFDWAANRWFDVDTDDIEGKTQKAQAKHLKYLDAAMNNLDAFGINNGKVFDRASAFHKVFGQTKETAELTADDIQEAKAALLMSISAEELIGTLDQKRDRDKVINSEIKAEKDRRALNPMYEMLRRNEENYFRAAERNRNLALTDWNKI